MDRKAIISLTVLAVAAVSGCSSKHRLVVGGKNFTEQDVLVEIIAQHLENRLGEPVTRKPHLGGTMIAYEGLNMRQIDMYPEYTGTVVSSIVKAEPDPDPGIMYERARSEMEKRAQVVVLKPLGFNNSFAMVIRTGDAKQNHIATLSDAVAFQPGWDIGQGYEFQDRPDGWKTLMRTYDLRLHSAPKTMDLGLLYPSLLTGKVSMIAGNETDGLLSRSTYTVLTDDKHAFPPYDACIMVRQKVLDENPKLRPALEELSGRIDNKTMRELNFQVDGLHTPAREVAAEWLKKAGL